MVLKQSRLNKQFFRLISLMQQEGLLDTIKELQSTGRLKPLLVDKLEFSW